MAKSCMKNNVANANLSFQSNKIVLFYHKDNL